MLMLICSILSNNFGQIQVLNVCKSWLWSDGWIVFVSTPSVPNCMTFWAFHTY